MSGASETVRVNFGKPMPVFPLGSVALLPHAVAPLHIFEPRYRQMVERALDGAGQVAMAVFEGERWKREHQGRPPIRPCVCVGQIIQHEKLPDGRYNVLLQGICRAKIRKENPPDGDRLYREALLAPLAPPDEPDEAMPEARCRLGELLSEPPLTSLAASEGVRSCLDDPETPAHAILELIGVSIVTDPEARYALLAEGDPEKRVELIETELQKLRRLLLRAELQLDPDAPRGCVWN